MWCGVYSFPGARLLISQRCGEFECGSQSAGPFTAVTQRPERLGRILAGSMLHFVPRATEPGLARAATAVTRFADGSEIACARGDDVMVAVSGQDLAASRQAAWWVLYLLQATAGPWLRNFAAREADAFERSSPSSEPPTELRSLGEELVQPLLRESGSWLRLWLEPVVGQERAAAAAAAVYPASWPLRGGLSQAECLWQSGATAGERRSARESFCPVGAEGHEPAAWVVLAWNLSGPDEPHGVAGTGAEEEGGGQRASVVDGLMASASRQLSAWVEKVSTLGAGSVGVQESVASARALLSPVPPPGPSASSSGGTSSRTERARLQNQQSAPQRQPP